MTQISTHIYKPRSSPFSSGIHLVVGPTTNFFVFISQQMALSIYLCPCVWSMTWCARVLEATMNDVLCVGAHGSMRKGV